MRRKLSKLSNSYFEFVETQQLAIFFKCCQMITMLGEKIMKFCEMFELSATQMCANHIDIENLFEIEPGYLICYFFAGMLSSFSGRQDLLRGKRGLHDLAVGTRRCGVSRGLEVCRSSARTLLELWADFERLTLACIVADL